MTVRLALDQGLERHLEQVAHSLGMEPSEFILHTLRRALAGTSVPERPHFERMTPEEWARFSEAWSNAHQSIPLLSDDGFSRESIYGDHP